MTKNLKNKTSLLKASFTEIDSKSYEEQKCKNNQKRRTTKGKS